MDNPNASLQDLAKRFLQLRGQEEFHASSVRWRNLDVVGAGLPAMPAPTVASYLRNLFDPRSYLRRPVATRKLLHGFNGTLEPGEMLMVIGKPGSGVTTFLKALTNLRGEYHSIDGDVFFGPWSAGEVQKNHARELTFCGEDDIHFPTLNVKETLSFALKAALGRDVSGKQLNANLQLLTEMFGIPHTLHTKVGGPAVRGVSGGERRRVSLAEALVTSPSVIAFDNPTIGLDSSTALEFVQLIRELTKVGGSSAAMGLYQGSNAMVPLFDKVLVINSGRQVYYGPLSEAIAYFESLGFYHDPRTSITDFLASMSAEHEDRKLRDGVNEATVPRSAIELEAAFERSQAGRDNNNSVDAAFEKVRQTPTLGKTSTFALPIWRQILLCLVRQWRIHITDVGNRTVEVSATILQSIVLGTIFWDLQHETTSLYELGSALFYAVLVPGLQSMSEFGNTFAQRPLLLKQRRYHFYRTLSYGYGQIGADMVWKVINICCNIPMYWMVNFQRTPGNFFFFLLTAYIAHMAMSVLFRLIAVLSPTMSRAALPVGVTLTTMVLYTGWYIPPPNMQIWLKWLRWLNPMYYGFESLMINEMETISYSCSSGDLVPSYGDIANQVCAIAGSEPGQAYVTGGAYLSDMYTFYPVDKWRNIGILAGLFLVLGCLVGLGMELFKPPAGKLATTFYNMSWQERKQTSTSTVSSATADVEKQFTEKELTAPVTLARGQSDSSNEKNTPQAEGAVVEPSGGHIFGWKDLTLDVVVNGEKRRLLNSISGIVRPGLTALMGVSGAGKTTLLNALAGRSEIGTLTGQIYIDGSPLPKSFRRRMGYVQQQDVHLPTQTVREALQMTARLRRPTSISDKEKDAYVEHVIDILEIRDYAEALIGHTGAGLNLEQRKRVSIGVELAAKPEILFLDEPTSGLDGQSAASIVRLLRRLSETGQNILCTIHQPAAEVIETFENVLLLVKGGNVAYHGPLGSNCSTAIVYFEQSARKCTEKENPAEYFLDVVGAGSRNANNHAWDDLWSKSDERQKQKADIESFIEHPISNTNAKDEPAQDSVYATSYLYQCNVVLRRAWLNYWRDPEYGAAKLWVNVWNALLNGLTFLQMAQSQAGAFDRVLTIFVGTLMGPPLGLQVERRFAALRDIYMLRERASYAYHWTIFVISAIVIEMPYATLTGLIYWLLWYYSSGMPYDTSRAGYMFVMYEFFAVFVVSLGYICASWLPSLPAAFTANGFFFMFVNTFAGTLTARPFTPTGWRWFFNVSPLYYVAEGMTVDALYDLTLYCAPGESHTVLAPQGMSCSQYLDAYVANNTGYLMNPDATENCEYCRYATGQQYYGAQYGYQWVNRDRNVGIIFGFICFNFAIVFLGTYLTRISKWSLNPVTAIKKMRQGNSKR